MIGEAPTDVVPYGGDLTVVVSGPQVTRLVLIGLGSVTHSFDAG